MDGGYKREQADLRMLVTFDSISSSLLLQDAYRERKVPCTLITVPRKVSASCGYAAEVEMENPEDLVNLLRELNAEWDAVYRPWGKEYEVIYKREAV